MKKLLLIAMLLASGYVSAATVLFVPQGGTGASTLSGCLTGNGTAAITGTGFACAGLGSLSATYPIIYTSGTGVISTAFSTTTANIFSNFNTFLSSTTLQAFTFTNATGTNATTTASFYSPSITATNFFGALTGNASTATKWATGRTLGITGDLTYTSPSFDGSANVTAAGTLATVNSNVGPFTNASITVNGKGLITAASSGTAPVTSITGTANRITVTGTVTPQIDIAATYVGQSSITTVGTLSSGAVPASLVTAGTFGTGAYTMDSTLTLGGYLLAGSLSTANSALFAPSANGVYGQTLMGVVRSGAGPVFRGITSGGTIASPTAVTSGSTMMTISSRAYNGTGIYDAANILAVATQTHAVGSGGAKWVFNTTPNTTVTPTTALTLDQDQSATFTGNITNGSNTLTTGAITSGLINGQTISSAANFTGTATIATSLDITGSAGARSLYIRTGGIVSYYDATAAEIARMQGASGDFIFSTIPTNSSIYLRPTGTGGLVVDSGGGIRITQAGAVTGGTYNSQTISSAANFTGTMAIVGGTANTSAGLTVGATTLPSGILSLRSTTHMVGVTPDTNTNAARGSALALVGYGTSPELYGALAGGTVTVPTGAPTNRGFLMRMLGYDTSVWAFGGAITAQPTETWTPTAHGQKWTFATIPNGTTGSGTIALTLDQDQSATFAGAVSGITTLTTSSTINSQTISSAANFTGTVTSAGLNTINAGGTNALKLGLNSDFPTYNLISFNGDLTNTGHLGITAGGGVDKSLYIDVPTGGAIRLRVNATNVLALSTTGDATFAGSVSGITTLATSGTINSQTISSAANFTGTLTAADAITGRYLSTSNSITAYSANRLSIGSQAGGAYMIAQGGASTLGVLDIVGSKSDGTGQVNYLQFAAGGAASFTGAITVADKITSTLGNNATLFLSQSATTGYQLIDILNTSGRARIMLEGSSAGTVATGSLAYASVFGSQANKATQFITNAAVQMTIDTSGNVGIGTTTPQSKLDVDIGGISGTLGQNSQSNIGLRTAGSAVNNLVQTVYGYATAATTYSPAAMGFIVTSAAGNTKGDLLFATRDVTTDTAPTERMRISSAGAMKWAAYGAGTLTTDASGNITAVSDERLKDIKGDFTKGLAEILKIKPILYNYNKKSGLDMSTTMAGFSAQNVQKVIPEAIGQSKDGYLTFSDRPVTAALVNAVKTIWDKVTGIDARVKLLEAQNKALEARLKALETKVK